MDALSGKNIHQLTSNDYNEHASYTPNGKEILWMTNSTCAKQGTDWWLMHSDGTGKQRITYFNEPSYPGYSGKRWACYGCFNPQGNIFLGGVQTNLFKQEGIIYKVEFLPCSAGDGLHGEYYDNINFAGAPKKRNDPAINFQWGEGDKDTMIASQEYSIRWTGYLEPLYTDNYTFFARNKENMEVWLNDSLLISPETGKNEFGEQLNNRGLRQGEKYKIKVEIHNKGNKRTIFNLAWSSSNQYKQVIPESQLFKQK
jgi:hypothetical protein